MSQTTFSLDSSYKKHFKNNKLDIEVNNCTLGLYVELTSIEIYDKFCNQGFRRSGRYLYKPDLLRNCCKLYTIRTSLNQCKFTKDLKTTMKRFKKFTGTTKYLNDNGLNSNNEQFDLVKETYLIDKYSLISIQDTNLVIIQMRSLSCSRNIKSQSTTTQM